MRLLCLLIATCVFLIVVAFSAPLWWPVGKKMQDCPAPPTPAPLLTKT